MRGRAIKIGACLAAIVACAPSQGRETITMWFWGATPNYREALEQALIAPFNASQRKYELRVQYRPSVDNDVRVALMGGGGPDLVYASGPANVALLARAGKLMPLDTYAKANGWTIRLQTPLLQSCTFYGHIYCLPLSMEADGLFYNKAVLHRYGWIVPRTEADAEQIMEQAQHLGLYASVTGNKRWQPVDVNYSSIFINNYLGQFNMTCLITGRSSWESPRLVQALTDLRSWYQRGFLGGRDYFALDFDLSSMLLIEGRSPFMFAPTILFQWFPRYLSGDRTDVIGFAPIPQMNSRVPYPFFDIGDAFTYSINAQSKVKDGAVAVLQMMLSPRFVTEIARRWPGYWVPPLKSFPTDPQASPLDRSFYAAIAQVSQAISSGSYGYRVDSFLPPATMQVLIKDVEAMWLDQETPQQVLAKVEHTFRHEQSRGLSPDVAPPLGGCPATIAGRDALPGYPTVQAVGDLPLLEQ